MVCHWVILPNWPRLTLFVDYSTLLPGEVLTLYLDKDVTRSFRSGDQPGVYSVTMYADRGIGISFKISNNSARNVGGFLVNWQSVDPTLSPFLSSQTLMVLLVCMTSAGALIAACCVYCICCNRRRRGVSAHRGCESCNKHNGLFSGLICMAACLRWQRVWSFDN